MKRIKNNTFRREPDPILHLEDGQWVEFNVNSKLTRHFICIPKSGPNEGKEKLRIRMYVRESNVPGITGYYNFFASHKLTELIWQRNFIYPGPIYKLERNYGYTVTNLFTCLSITTRNTSRKYTFKPWIVKNNG